MTADDIVWQLLPQDEAAARQRLAARPDDGLAAAGLLLAIAIEYADFRGLSEALATFARHDDDTPALLRDVARISRPSLDGGFAFDAACEQAAERVHQTLQRGESGHPPSLSPDARMLVLKLLLDYRGQQLDLPRIEQLIAFGHELCASASPVWQGRWWLLVLQNREWFGDAAGTAQALAEANRLVRRHALPRLRFELCCVEMSAALKADDLAQADRLFRELEALRPAVRPGRLPHGLRAQALYLARRGELGPALRRIELLLALCEDMAVPRRDVGPYQVLRADCLLGLGRGEEALALLQAEAQGQQGAQGELFAARMAVHRAAALLDDPGAEADAACVAALQACARLRYSRFLRPLPQWAARLVERGWALGVEPEFLAAVVQERRLQPSNPGRLDWPWRLRVQVLGPMQVWRDGLLLAGEGKAARKPLELLRLLAAHGGGPLAVSLVIDALWPSLDAEAPRASFEMAVSRLRKWLGLPEAVRVADDAVSLDRASVWVDVAAFEHALEQDRVEEALRLYRAPLLGAESLDGLLHTARERLALRHAQRVQQQSQRLLEAGQGAAAVALLQRALGHEPLSESLHRALMRAWLQQGERAEALRAYRRVCEMLRKQLGVGPSEQTVQLAREAGA